MGKDEDIGSQQEQNPIKLKLKGPSPFPPSTFLISFLNEWVINAEYATISIFSEWYQKPVNVCVYLANEMSYCFDYLLVSQVSLFIYLDLARWKLLLLFIFLACHLLTFDVLDWILPKTDEGQLWTMLLHTAWKCRCYSR